MPSTAIGGSDSSRPAAVGPATPAAITAAVPKHGNSAARPGNGVAPLNTSAASRDGS